MHQAVKKHMRDQFGTFKASDKERLKALAENHGVEDFQYERQGSVRHPASASPLLLR